MYLTPDLTAENELYKVDNDQRMIITGDQVISFPSPVYLDTVSVIQLGTTNRTLVKNADWAVREEDKDIEAMSAMRLVDSTFSKILIKSLVIIKPYVSADYKINLSYQKLYPIPFKLALYPDTEPLTVTPDLIRDLLETVKRHDYLLSPIQNVHTLTSTTPMLLEPDPHKEKPENFIINETHLINVPENVSVIHPIAGPFFKDSLSIFHVESGNTLAEGVDYQVFGVDLHRTAMSSNPSGVYRFIVFLNNFVGTVKPSYHAYGGDPTLADVNALYEMNNNLTTFVTESQLLTPLTVSAAPAIVLMRNKIAELEETMRRLATTGRPTYGDVSSGGTLKKRIASPDTEHHWWTIASLFKVEGSSDVFVADTMKLRFQSFYTKFAFDAIVNVNLLHPTDKLDVKILSATYPKGYIPFTDYSEVPNIMRPQFRIVWNENTAQDSGAYLQIGMRLKTVAEETIVIEDWSGAESAWKLIPSPDQAVLPEDSVLTLPNSAHIWDSLNPDSRETSYLLPFADGHLVWAGSEALNRPSSGWKNIQLTHLLEKEIDITKIKKMRLDLEELGANKFPVVVEFIPGSEDLVASTSFTYNGKAAYLTGRIYRNPATQAIEISVNADITAGLTSTQLNLRQVLIFL